MRRIANRERAVRQCFELLPTLGISSEAYSRIIAWMHAAESELRADATRWDEEALLKGIRAVAPRPADRQSIVLEGVTPPRWIDPPGGEEAAAMTRF